MNLKEILLLAASVGFFIIWGLEVYNGIPLKASYFWLMFGMGCLFYFQYSKNIRLKKEGKNPNMNTNSSSNTNPKQNKSTPKNKK
jgi:hypothetical protein